MDNPANNFSQQLGQANDFLKLVFPDVSGYIEIRAIDKSKKVSRRFFRDPEEAALHAVKMGAERNHNIYVGMAERKSSSAGTKENVLRSHVKWCEIDAASYGNDKEKALERVQQLQNLEGFPGPTVVNNTGHGYLLSQRAYPIAR